MINFLDEIIEPMPTMNNTTIIVLSITLFVVVITGIVVSVLLKNSTKKK